MNVEVFCHGRLIGFISAGKACQTGHVSETIPASSVQTTTYDISTTSLRVCWSVGSVAISTLQPCQVKTYTSQCQTEAASTDTRSKRNYPHIITYRQQRWLIPQSFDSSVTPSAQESSLIRIFQRRQFSAAAGLFSLVLHARGNMGTERQVTSETHCDEHNFACFDLHTQLAQLRGQHTKSHLIAVTLARACKSYTHSVGGPSARSIPFLVRSDHPRESS